ncbi:MAG TPA: hypothetical protein VIH98_13155 [Xanthobacteraceae bacterium]|jgi:hypothetical protein
MPLDCARPHPGHVHLGMFENRNNLVLQFVLLAAVVFILLFLSFYP